MLCVRQRVEDINVNKAIKTLMKKTELSEDRDGAWRKKVKTGT